MLPMKSACRMQRDVMSDYECSTCTSTEDVWQSPHAAYHGICCVTMITSLSVTGVELAVCQLLQNHPESVSTLFQSLDKPSHNEHMRGFHTELDAMCSLDSLQLLHCRTIV
eukprot:jgi/Ulvmu1/11161/UM071_0045.1